SHPIDPIDHLIKAIRQLQVRVLGVSLYSQAIEKTMEGLIRIRRECPDVRIVLGGPHPTEAYLSLVGLRFVDYVVRGEAERSFPALVEAIIAGDLQKPLTIPGVYSYDAEHDGVCGAPEPFVDLAALDAEGTLRYELSPQEIRQYRL